MKFETLMLQCLFTVCLLVGVLTLGAMLTSHANASTVAAGHAHVAATANRAA